MRARGHQKLSIFLMVASPCRNQFFFLYCVKKNKKFSIYVVHERGSTYPHVKSTRVWDVVVYVAVVTQTDDAEPDQGTHVQGKDGDQQRLHTFQITVQENGHEHDLQDRAATITSENKLRNLTPVCKAFLHLNEKICIRLPGPQHRRWRLSLR